LKKGTPLDEGLRQYLEGMEARLKDYIDERKRNLQTELLRGYEAFSSGHANPHA
jgi:hypothetical protein